MIADLQHWLCAIPDNYLLDFPPFPVINSDPDDVQSIVLFLLYSNVFDIEGLNASAR
jgi:hypothetical protein